MSGIGQHRRGKSWGIEGYLTPNNDWAWMKPRTFWSKSKKENFMETQAKKKKDLPAPTAYDIKSAGMWSGQYPDCTGHSGRWLKKDKTSYIDDILKLKKLKLPGPGQYKVKDFKITNVPKQNSEKGDFINNCKWYGMQTPGWKYKINYESIRPKTPSAKYYVAKDAEGKDKRPEPFSIKAKKTKDPAPGSYEVIECIKKTQWPKNMFAFHKEKQNTYVDRIVKSKSIIPGIGKYKDLDKGYNILSTPPTSLRRLR